MYTLIDGKATATAIKQQIADEVKEMVAKGAKRPCLAAVLVGHDGGSETYVKNKESYGSALQRHTQKKSIR